MNGDENRRLTLLQERFCQEYIVDGNATRSAIAAGYSESSACEIGSQTLRLIHVSKRIAQLESERLLRTKISADYVLSSIKETAEEAKEDKEYSAALRGFEKLGAHLQLFVEKSESKVEQVIRVTADDDIGIPD